MRHSDSYSSCENTCQNSKTPKFKQTSINCSSFDNTMTSVKTIFLSTADDKSPQTMELPASQPSEFEDSLDSESDLPRTRLFGLLLLAMLVPHLVFLMVLIIHEELLKTHFTTIVMAGEFILFLLSVALLRHTKAVDPEDPQAIDYFALLYQGYLVPTLRK